MRHCLIWVAVLTLLLAPVVPALAEDVSVKGYFHRDGTYVRPHMRSAPGSSFNSNWSAYPGITPYTGQQGTRQPRLYDYSSGSGFSGSGSGLGIQPRSRSRS